MLVDGAAHVSVLVARPREQLDGQDVGVGVDDAAGQHRTRLGHVARTVAHLRHEEPQQHEVAAEPQQHRQREPFVGRGEQQRRAGAVHQDVPNGGEQRDHALAHRRPGLHHLVGDAARKVVLEERPGLPHHVPMALPADQVADIGRDRLVGDHALRGHGERPRHQQHHRHAGEQGPIIGHQPFRPACGQQRDDAADEHRDHRIEQRDHEAGDEQRGQQPLRLAGKVPIERHQRGRRLGGRRQRCGLEHALQEGEHRAISQMQTRPRGGALPAGGRISLSNAAVCYAPFMTGSWRAVDPPGGAGPSY